jgi:hypothetical protein
MLTIWYTYSHGEIELACELEYSFAQSATETDPAYPASAVLITAKIQGVDISPLLDDRIVAMIEEGATWSMQS